MRLRKTIETAALAARDMAWGANIASVSLARNPRKMLAYVSECLALYKSSTSRRGLPERHIREILPCDDVATIRLGTLHAGDTWLRGSSWSADIVNLCLICQLAKPRMVFEIGTLQGYTSYHFALNTPEDTEIFTLDLPKENGVKPRLRTTLGDDSHIDWYVSSRHYWFEDTTHAGKITRLFGDSALFDYSRFHGKIDFFFIDGAHSYEYVRSDTLNALKCCRPGGIIAWHDFGRVGTAGVSRWILELSKEREIYAVAGSSIALMIAS